MVIFSIFYFQIILKCGECGRVESGWILIVIFRLNGNKCEKDFFLLLNSNCNNWLCNIEDEMFFKQKKKSMHSESKSNLPRL